MLPLVQLFYFKHAPTGLRSFHCLLRLFAFIINGAILSFDIGPLLLCLHCVLIWIFWILDAAVRLLLFTFHLSPMKKVLGVDFHVQWICVGLPLRLFSFTFSVDSVRRHFRIPVYLVHHYSFWISPDALPLCLHRSRSADYLPQVRAILHRLSLAASPHVL